jgi:alpha-L-rhamnosidase
VANPLGFAIEKPTLCWIVEDTPDTTQVAAQITVSLDESFNQILFDSGKVDGSAIDSLGYRPPIQLKPRTRYFWKVHVWGETESVESETVWFETAKMDENWQAEWITPDWNDNHIHPILYRHFDLPY